jgi:phosphatidylglycerophosphatase A
VPAPQAAELPNASAEREHDTSSDSQGIMPAMNTTAHTRASRAWLLRSPLGLLAAGTAGTLVGLLLYWPLTAAPLVARVSAVVLVFFLGVWGATLVARHEGREDPGLAVVDEIVGMWISLLWLPWSLKTVVAAFFLFRLMDVVKPFPARRLEDLPRGWGIMADDVMAGIYANVVLQVMLRVGWLP